MWREGEMLGAESEGDEGYMHAIIIISISTKKNELISQKWSEVLSRRIMGRANPSCRAVWHGSAAARLLGLRVRIPPWERICVFCECCVLSGLRVGLITRQEDAYRVYASMSLIVIMREPRPIKGCCATKKKKLRGVYSNCDPFSTDCTCIQAQIRCLDSWLALSFPLENFTGQTSAYLHHVDTTHVSNLRVSLLNKSPENRAMGGIHNMCHNLRAG